MSTKLLSFHNDPAIKAKYISRVESHRLADELIRGIGWENGKGCAVGCTLETYDHSRYPIELGIPEWLAHLEDSLFEGMPEKMAMDWPKKFLEAIPIGVDLEPVKWKLAIWRHEIQLVRLQNNSMEDASKCREAIQKVIDFCTLNLNGAADTESARSAARSAAMSAESASWSAAESARSAARSAAMSAAESTSWSAAMSAARSAESAAESAAEYAAESAESTSWSAAMSAAYLNEAERLLILLSESK